MDSAFVRMAVKKLMKMGSVRNVILKAALNVKSVTLFSVPNALMKKGLPSMELGIANVLRNYTL